MDGRPKRRVKVAFSNCSGVVWTGDLELLLVSLQPGSFFTAQKCQIVVVCGATESDSEFKNIFPIAMFHVYKH